MKPSPKDLTVTEEDIHNFKRLDQFLVANLDESRSAIKSLFEKGNITSTAPLSLKKMPPAGTSIYIQREAPIPEIPTAEEIELDIIFEDEYLMFINKPVGLVIHPAPGNYSGTLVNALLHHYPPIKGIGDPKRPGIVHRLDKGTSGVMVVAKEQKCYEGLVKLFSTHDINRKYECLIVGTEVPKGGTLRSTIGRHPQNRLKMAANVQGGKEAITHYSVLEYFDKMCHLEVTLETGRTHQIRVHTSQLLKKPILMDPLYGNPKQHLQIIGDQFLTALKDYDSPLLHAKTLGLIHPITKATLSFTVDAPSTFLEILDIARA